MLWSRACSRTVSLEKRLGERTLREQLHRPMVVGAKTRKKRASSRAAVLQPETERRRCRDWRGRAGGVAGVAAGVAAGHTGPDLSGKRSQKDEQRRFA